MNHVPIDRVPDGTDKSMTEAAQEKAAASLDPVEQLLERANQMAGTGEFIRGVDQAASTLRGTIATARSTRRGHSRSAAGSVSV